MVNKTIKVEKFHKLSLTFDYTVDLTGFKPAIYILIIIFIYISSFDLFLPCLYVKSMSF